MTNNNKQISTQICQWKERNKRRSWGKIYTLKHIYMYMTAHSTIVVQALQEVDLLVQAFTLC